MDNATSNSKAIAVRPTEEKDIAYVLGAEAGEENAPYVAQWSRQQHLDAIEDVDIKHIIIEETENGSIIGYAIIAGIKSNHNAIELRRIVITEKGRGYGRRALQLIKALSFNEWGAHRLWLDVREKNQRAQSLYMSEGFVKEGLLRECVLCQGGYESIYIMSILKHEFNS